MGREWGLEESEFEFGFVAHHVFGPFGLEDDVDVDRLDAFDALELVAGVFDEEVGGRAVWGCQGHVDVEIAVVVDLDAVDEPQAVDVYGYLRVEDRAEHLDGLFFYLCALLFCHNSAKIIKRGVMVKFRDFNFLLSIIPMIIFGS